MYKYLTGSTGPFYRQVTADDAVHSMFISNPNGILDALRSCGF